MVIDTIPDFMGEVYDWLVYVTGIDGGKIFRGNQAREVLPADNDYIVYTPITQVRHGTNVATLYADGVPSDENASETNAKLLEVDLQIDCYGEKAFAYAEGIENFAHSGRCNAWLQQNKMGIRVLYADNPFDGTLVDDTRQYVTRWITTLAICFPVSVTDKIPWIEDVVVTPNPGADSPTPVPSPDEREGVTLINIDVEYKE